MTIVSTTPTKSAAAASAVLPTLNETWDDSAKIVKGKADDGVKTWTCGWCNEVKCHLNPTKVLTHVAKVHNPNAHISACAAQIPVVHLQRHRDLFNAKQKKKNAKKKAKKQINNSITNNIEKVTKTRLGAKRGNDEAIELLGEEKTQQKKQGGGAAGGWPNNPASTHQPQTKEEKPFS